jgi:hypothetical protein
MTQTAAQQQPAETIDDVVAPLAAARRGYTGIVTGEPFADDQGTRWHQVFEYTNGRCTDAYVSRHGQQI